MKSHESFFLVLALVVFGLLSPGLAHASFIASTISGTYGFAVQGFNMRLGDPAAKSTAYALIGTMSFHADGTVSRAFTLSLAGQILSATDSGTYTVNEDCSGTTAFFRYRVHQPGPVIAMRLANFRPVLKSKVASRPNQMYPQ
jgi:hypothetical protein